MFPKPKAPQPETLPPWAEGQVTLFAFQALKRAYAAHGYVGRAPTMRKLEARGLVRQIEGGAYVITEDGKQLVEGYITCPPEYDRQPAPEWPSPYQRRRAAEQERAPIASPRSYAVERVEGGCEVIRFPSRRDDRAPRR
ncbi:hypothetical protein ASF60_22800 [Methylobacterium sp. Leaf113]|uniref:hypothetical protein n=1 Tax=Methylobacterium sp. Leaf113 TaxID=1736259 RepID=UPI0006F2F922|nr:hypothetical protein [Methylobacterium sp. Leaf113]KQP79444.1 hypothetical protein ASF60_22800 [Methylobacterium sp. Leaf113]